MKKKNNKNSKNKIIIILIFIIIIVISITVIIVNNKKKLSESNTTSSIVDTTVSKQTIKKTLTGSGEIETSTTEKLTLNTSYYFLQMCVEEGDSIAEGENILEYTNGKYLTAPYSLVVSSISVPSSGSICSSSNYIEVENTDTLDMILSVNESDISKVKLDQEATITINAIDGKTYTGKITKIDQKGTYSTSGSTFTVNIEFSNDGNVKLGMSATCEIILEQAVDTIAVPVASVQTSGNEKYVMVVQDDGTTKNVNIETGISNDTYVQVTSGLNGDEKIKTIETTSTSSRSYNTSSSSGNMGQMSRMMSQDGNDSNKGGMPGDSGSSSRGNMPTPPSN